MKIIPKLQTAWSPIILQQDNTRIKQPLVVTEIDYKLQPGEFFYTDKSTGKKTLVRPKQEVVSSDNRSDFQRKQDAERSERLMKKYEEQKQREEAAKAVSVLTTLISPSTWIGPLIRNNGKSYFDNFTSGGGFGDNTTNFIFDLASPFLFNRVISTVNRGANFLSRANSVRSTVLTDHLQGNEAVKMFKQYGGISIPKNSEIEKQLMAYVPETRIRYGLVNNSNITDKEIAESLYKQLLDNNVATLNGQPIIGFRGDTKRYTTLIERMSPEELSQKSGTMDNSLGNLFLGEYPGTVPNAGLGLERYTGYYLEQPEYGIYKLYGSGTGSKATINGQTKDAIDVKLNTNDLRLLYQIPIRRGNRYVYRVPADYLESGTSDINAFMFRTPNIRDATNEISVLDDDLIVNGFRPSKYISKTSSSKSERELMAEHYRGVLNDAKKNQQGLLYSRKAKPGEEHPLRDEHENYTYFALPNFNIRNAKHILPYDLRIPRNWTDLNIYRTIIPITIGIGAQNKINTD